MQGLTYVLAGLMIASPAVALADDAVPAPAEGEAAPAPTTGGEATPAAGGGDAAVPMKKMTVGADLAFVLPLSDYGDVASAAIGVLGRFEFAVNPQLSVTARVGYLYNLVKNVPSGASASLGMIPLLLGGTYNIGTSGLFAYAEVGVTNIRVSASAGGMDFSDSKTKLSFGAGAGYQMKKIKARAGFFMPGSQDNSDGMGGTKTTTLFGILASVGYDFASF